MMLLWAECMLPSDCLIFFFLLADVFFVFFARFDWMTVQVMLLKAEFMYGEASEVLVAEHTILGARRRKTVSFFFVGRRSINR